MNNQFRVMINSGCIVEDKKKMKKRKRGDKDRSSWNEYLIRFSIWLP